MRELEVINKKETEKARKVAENKRENDLHRSQSEWGKSISFRFKKAQAKKMTKKAQINANEHTQKNTQIAVILQEVPRIWNLSVGENLGKLYFLRGIILIIQLNDDVFQLDFGNSMTPKSCNWLTKNLLSGEKIGPKGGFFPSREKNSQQKSGNWWGKNLQKKTHKNLSQN